MDSSVIALALAMLVICMILTLAGCRVWGLEWFRQWDER